MLNRLAIGAAVGAFSCLPLFPAFIMLAGVPVPGVSVVPPLATKALLLLTALAVILALPAVLRVRRPVVLLVPLALWFGAALLASAIGFDPLGGVLFLTIFGFGVLWHIAIVRFASEPGFLRACIVSFIISGGCAAALAIALAALKVPAALYTIAHGRATGTFILPGELAGYLVVYVPLAIAVARTAKRRLLRIVAATGAAVGLLALFMTYSRAGEIGFAAAAAAYFLMRPRGARVSTALAVLAAGAALVLFLFNAHHNPSENFTRLSIWSAALRMVERFPLTGVGLFGFAKVYALVRAPDGEATAFHAHSFLLTTVAEMGLVGLAAVIYAWVCFARELRARIGRAGKTSATLAVAVAAGLTGTWVQGLIDTVSIVIFGLWLPFMALALEIAGEAIDL